ncbi:hypothetical protein CHI12_12465 [Terribacillus saccharophilus]|jgi:hypothetical protein|uniref:DUF4190 domain-containing protein n=1 Tax=Terribacillus saccharophilus TaxID=361277 RepID=A0A268HBP6_9BACI|nr:MULTISPECIES: hypothetical protein [Terribacillus]PAD35595.1 hypothetical protein CHH56_09055 [Terribacillus saccharophilus]PAD96444.1 hypothetical protein CHH50_07505 [Terribacillus saccharophilus]PAE00020.1 hypothetical protein CHH48_08410 [Terribacillus saccharophilus]PAE07284.1 hypothetical protein CHI12_12465 [Terribacillus saccharophilus]
MKNRSLLSLVFGTISLFFSLYGIFFGIIGFVLAIQIIRKDTNPETGRKMAVGGLVTSVIGAGYQIVAILILLLTA